MIERVVLRFHGLMLEKLVQRALAEGVTFFQVRRLGPRDARFTTDAPGADKLLCLAERFSLDLTVVSRAGPGVLVKKIRARWTLPVAFLLVGLLCAAFLSRLWIVQVNMLGGGDPRTLENALAELDVAPGASMRQIDPSALALKLHAAAPDLAYVGARKQGVRLLIEAAQALPAPDLYDPAAARDLVAARDALLLTLDVNAGTAACAPGHVVRKGQVLIRGEERDGRDTLRGVCALGSAVGRVWLTGEAEAPLSRTQIVDTGQISTESALRLMRLSCPLTFSSGYPLERTQVNRLPIGGLLVPLYIERTHHIQQQMRLVSPDIQTLKKEIAQIALNQALSQAPLGISPVDKWVDYSMIEGGRIKARAVVEIRINIAVSRGA
ncbi:MAG: sporulation protein YqfD [Clostridia bacterium]